MSKRAVTISYEMLKEFLVKDYMIELIECLEGIPEDSVCIAMFPGSIDATVTMVFESDNWDNEPSEHTVYHHSVGTVHCHNVEYKKFFADKQYAKVIDVNNGDRFIVTSKTPIRIRTHKSNHSCSILDARDAYFAKGTWLEIEELT